MPDARNPTGVHLVGSVPVKSAEEMFRLTMANLRGYIKRLPDGEVGERDMWIRWQYSKIGQSEQMQPMTRGSEYVPMPVYGVADGVTSADDIEFPNLGYADAAIESFGIFQRLTEEGVIPENMRFQVGIPTPLSVAVFYVAPPSRNLFEQSYGRAIKQELARMLKHIPGEKLAIQWETVGEFGLLDGLMDNHLDGDLLENITDRVAELVDMVDEPAETGMHLCYGDSGHKHFCEPADAGYLTQVANGTVAKAHRSVNWVHMPVPRDRDDAGFFTPLADLVLPESTDLYLGLVHMTGGEEGTANRIQAAARVVPRFGVATECGFGRRDIETIPGLMQQHTAVTHRV
jgi:hypothetical protein